jgi:3-oxoacyl-[acyl-carrier protein] reductase
MSTQEQQSPSVWHGVTALVTGGASGIGAATADRLAAEGARVAVLDRDVSAVGGRHVAVRADVTDDASVRAGVDSAVAELGGLDVLVNNAGTFGAADPPHPVFGTDYEQWQATWRRTFDVNLFGAANAAWAAAQHMRERGGRIVNVSSRGAFRGEPEQPAYGASKAAMNSMGQSLAVALAPYGIAVATVAPGFIATDMTNEHLKAERGDAIRAQSPFGRVAEPDEVAAAVHWLASAEAEWASGTIVDLNGASYLRT